MPSLSDIFLAHAKVSCLYVLHRIQHHTVKYCLVLQCEKWHESPPSTNLLYVVDEATPFTHSLYYYMLVVFKANRRERGLTFPFLKKCNYNSPTKIKYCKAVNTYPYHVLHIDSNFSVILIFSIVVIGV